jgi:type I restriction enzyme, S subunit
MMLSDLKPYPRYTEKVTDALPAIPEQWGARRIKTVLREVDRRSGTGTERLLSLRAASGLVDHEAAGGRLIPAEALTGFKLVTPGQLVMNRMRAATGVFGLARSDGLVSPDYAVFERTAECDPSFLLELLRARPIAAEMRRRSRGMGTGESGFLRLYSDAFGSMAVPWPTGDEQAAIVKYLAHAHHRIDRAIAAKRKLIALLEEQKQAVINQAVTRGLDPTTPVKESGIPWLGRVPAHWDVARLGWHVDLLTGYPFESAGFSGGLDAVRLLRGVNVGPGNIHWDEVVGWPPAGANGLARFALRPGDIVLGMDRPMIGGGVRVATVGASDSPSFLVQRVARLRPKPTLHADLLMLLLAGRGFVQYLTPIFTGISVPHLSPTQIRDYVVALPPMDEQKVIAAHIDRETSTSSTTIDRARREIDLLRELRTRRTSDVVTGQVDVRHIAATLPDLDPGEFTADVSAMDDDLVDTPAEFMEDVDA